MPRTEDTDSSRGTEGADSEAGLSPEEAFGLLADETRVSILQALGEAADGEDSAVPFAELRRQVGVRDAGRFNYHLDKLRGHFVRKTEDGYLLRHSGQMVVAAVLAGTYTDRSVDRQAETAYECPDCGDPLVATYADQTLTVECPEHSHRFRTKMPPGASKDRSIEDLVSLATRRARQFVERARDGFCPVCWGRVDTWLEPTEGEGVPHAGFDCRRCWMYGVMEVSGWIAGHLAVMGFLHDHGVSIDEATVLDSVYLGSRENATVVSEDPPKVRLALRQAGEELRVTLDEDATVVDATRREV